MWWENREQNPREKIMSTASEGMSSLSENLPGLVGDF